MEMSILITNEAKRELDKLLENSDKQCIRILTRGITMTSEAKIDLELDEPNANDNLYDVDGYKIIINKIIIIFMFLCFPKAIRTLANNFSTIFFMRFT